MSPLKDFAISMALILLIIVSTVIFLNAVAKAEEADFGVSARIIQCGTKETMVESCIREDLCCQFIGAHIEGENPQLEIEIVKGADPVYRENEVIE